jgi:hypothetical protein
MKRILFALLMLGSVSAFLSVNARTSSLLAISPFLMQAADLHSCFKQS